eukprot:scaffold70717_cov42-Cyclotella_meneghiniana.AAC.5
MRTRVTDKASLCSTTPLTSPPLELLSPLGAASVVQDPISLDGVLRGCLSLHRPRLGVCHVWWSSPSLWIPVAQALGFQVTRLLAPSSPTATILAGVTGVALSSRKRKATDELPCIIFCDWGCLPHTNASHWTFNRCPLLVAGPVPAWSPPSGWDICTMSFSHAAAGGATDGIFVISLIAPVASLLRPSHLPALLRRPGGVISASLDCRAPCFCALPTPPVVPGAGVRRLCMLEDGTYGSWGLFPSQSLRARIVVPSDFSPSGFGVRTLTPRELSDLWNTPILIQDAFVKANADQALRSFASSVPAKVLSVGADYLLDPDATLEVQPECEEGDVLKQDGQKADDAKVPTHIWEDFFCDTRPHNLPPLPHNWRTHLEPFRKLGLIYWRRFRLRSFWWWVAEKIHAKVWRLMPGISETVYWDDTRERYCWSTVTRGKQKYQQWMKSMLAVKRTAKIWEPARECIHKAAAASWWEWSEGSRPFFWLWRPSAQKWAQEGQPHYQVKKLPTFTKPQKAPKSDEDRIKVWRKVFRLGSAGISTKGKKDIRMVYNGTASGVNDCLFYPHFGLPTINHVTRALAPSLHLGVDSDSSDADVSDADGGLKGNGVPRVIAVITMKSD